MTPDVLRTVLVTALFFGVFVLVPIMLGMLRHQQKMTALIHGTKPERSELPELLRAVSNVRNPIGNLPELEARIEALEAEVRLLRGTRSDVPELRVENS